MVADAGQVLDAAAADHDHAVLLEVVADAGDVGRDLGPVGQADARDLPQRGVRLLRRDRPDHEADPALRRVPLHRGRLALLLDLLTPLAHKLADCRHAFLRSFASVAAIKNPAAALPHAGQGFVVCGGVVVRRALRFRYRTWGGGWRLPGLSLLAA